MLAFNKNFYEEMSTVVCSIWMLLVSEWSLSSPFIAYYLLCVSTIYTNGYSNLWRHCEYIIKTMSSEYTYSLHQVDKWDKIKMTDLSLLSSVVHVCINKEGRKMKVWSRCLIFLFCQPDEEIT